MVEGGGWAGLSLQGFKRFSEDLWEKKKEKGQNMLNCIYAL